MSDEPRGNGKQVVIVGGGVAGLEALLALDDLRTAGSRWTVAHLLVVEYLVGGQRASSVDRFELGLVHRGRRRLRVTYTARRVGSTIGHGHRRSWL